MARTGFMVLAIVIAIVGA